MNAVIEIQPIFARLFRELPLGARQQVGIFAITQELPLGNDPCQNMSRTVCPVTGTSLIELIEGYIAIYI